MKIIKGIIEMMEELEQKMSEYLFKKGLVDKPY